MARLTMEEVLPWWKNKNNRILAVTVFSVLITFITVWILQVPQKLLTLRASAYTAQVFLQPDNPQIPPAGNQALKLMVTTDKPVSFTALELNFDATKLQLTQEVTVTHPSLSQVVQKTALADANNSGKISLVLGQQPGTATPSGTFQLAAITVAAKNTAPNTVTPLGFNASAFQFVANDTQLFTVTGTALPVTLNYTAGAKLYFSPPLPANPQTVNTPFTADILVDTANQEIYGVDARLVYDKTKIEITRIDQGTETGFTSFPVKSYDNAAGAAQISANIGSATQAAAIKGAALNLAKITFKPLAAATEIGFSYTAGDRNDSNIVLKPADAVQDPVDILSSVASLTVTANQPGVSPSPSPSLSPSPSPSPSVSPNPSVSPSPSPSPSASPTTLTIKIRFQGRNRAGADNNQAITLSYKTVGQANAASASLATNNSGEASISLPAGQYLFLIKANGYLARKFGSDANPIVLNGNSHYLNLSENLILGGDFNNDGVINEVDYTAYFLAQFGSANTLTDIDRSGQVNNLDFAIMRANWNLTNDAF